MKKMFCSIMVLILSINYTLISQNNPESFLTFVEEMQYNDMEASINWFRKNKYDFNKHKIDENIFDFYRGVARFSSFQNFHGAKSELRLAIQDFYKVLTSGTSYNEYYSDRALLYIAAALMELRDDKEISARIFQYFVDNAPTTHPYYTTALFWQTYLRFLDATNYRYNYETLSELSENDNIIVYDYSTASTKDLFQIMHKLKTPEEVSLHQYKWSRDTTDIITLIKSVILNEKIYDNPNIPDRMAREQRYVRPKGILKPSVVTIPGAVEKPSIEINNNDSTSKTDPNNTGVKVPSRNLRASDMADFRLIVEKNDDDIPIKIEVAGKTILTRKSQKYTIYINPGTYNIVSTYNKKSYTNSISVSNDKTNILTIIAQSPASKESYVQFIITLDGIKRANSSKQALAENNETIDKIKNLLLQDPAIAIKWFNINYYEARYKMTPEEYSYYRGIAYYKQFLQDQNPSYAAQAKFDLEFVYNNRKSLINTDIYNAKAVYNNTDILINTEIYLANIETYAYGNYNDAERFLMSATKKIEGTNHNQYLPTIEYWRVRIGAIDAKETSKLKKMLVSKPKTTSILDMKTGEYQILAIMYPKIDLRVSVLPASRITAKAFLSHPGQNTNKPKVNVRNIPLYVELLGKSNNTTIQFMSVNDNKYQIPYKDKLFLGKNKLAINWGSQIFYIDIDTKQNESYSILLLSN